MSAGLATLLEAGRLGVRVTLSADAGKLHAEYPRHPVSPQVLADIEALRDRIKANKPDILDILQAPPEATEIVAVKVWSEVLQEAVWVVADGLPLDAYLGDGQVLTHREVRVLLEHGRGVKVWAPLDGEMLA